MKYFAVYIKPESDNTLETAIFVPEKFSIMAAIFQFFWAGYHRMWFEAAALVFIGIAFNMAEQQGWVSVPVLAVLNLSLVAYVGLSANDWRQAHLRRKGYVLMDIVTGRDEIEVQRRFYTHLLTRKKSSVKSSVNEAAA